MLYFLQKRNYRRSKEKLRKIRNLYRKNKSFWQICGRDDVFWRNTRQGLLPDDTWKKNFRILKGNFEALAAELRPYISPNPLSPNHKALNAEKKVAITFNYLKDTAFGMIANSFGVAICSCLSKYAISQLYSNKELIKCWTISLTHLKFFLFKFEVVSLAIAAASMAYLRVQ